MEFNRPFPPHVSLFLWNFILFLLLCCKKKIIDEMTSWYFLVVSVSPIYFEDCFKLQTLLWCNSLIASLFFGCQTPFSFSSQKQSVSVQIVACFLHFYKKCFFSSFGYCARDMHKIVEFKNWCLISLLDISLEIFFVAHFWQ